MDSEINAACLFLGHASKDFLVANLKNTRLFGYVHNFSVDYVTVVDDILDIHKYLVKKIYI